jgi:hypothetical protein
MPPHAEATVAIDAPIDLVWSVMTDTARYREWNPFVVELAPVGGALAVGGKIHLRVQWGRGGGAETVEVVTRLEAPTPAGSGPRRSLMEYQYLGWLPRLALVRGSRQQSLEQQPGQATVYRTAETFTGLLARGVPLAKVQDGFERHAQALKQRAESLRGKA